MPPGNGGFRVNEGAYLNEKRTLVRMDLKL